MKIKIYIVIAMIVYSASLISGCITNDATTSQGTTPTTTSHGTTPATVQNTVQSTPVTQVAKTMTTLRLAEMWDIKNIDPAIEGTVLTEKAAIGETLVGANPDFSLKPYLATSWQQVDNNTWEFKLRNDVLFHDGTKMTANDVKETLERVVSKNSRDKAMLKMDSVDVIDDYTIHIKTTQENPIVPGVLHYPDTAILSKNSYDKDGNIIKPIATGPYKFESFDEQTSTLTVVRNDKWWGGKVGLDKMILKGMPDPNTRAMAIENGDIDFTVDVPYSETDRIDKIDGINVEKYATPRVYRISANLKKDSLSDIRVRQAISYAIDRDGIVQHVLYNVGKPAAGPFLPDMIWSNKSLKPYPRDIEKAKKLLTDAGWIDTNGDGIREKNGKQLKLELLTYPARPGLPPMAEAISAELKDVGISVQPIIMDNSAITDKMKGDWDLYLAAYNVAMVPDPAYVLTNWYTTTGPDNPTGYSNPKVDTLIEEASKIRDINERYKKFNDVEWIVYDEQPIIIVAYYGCAIVKQDYVKGYKFDPTAHDYRINAGMYIEK